MDMQIVALDMGPFTVSEEITDNDLQSEMQLKIGAVLKYRPANDNIGTMVNIAFESNNKELLIFGVMLTMHVEGWDAMINGKSDEEIKKISVPIWDKALTFAAGILAEKTKATKMSQAFLPSVDCEQFAAIVKIEKESE